MEPYDPAESSRRHAARFARLLVLTAEAEAAHRETIAGTWAA